MHTHCITSFQGKQHYARCRKELTYDEKKEDSKRKLNLLYTKTPSPCHPCQPPLFSSYSFTVDSYIMNTMQTFILNFTASKLIDDHCGTLKCEYLSDC